MPCACRSALPLASIPFRVTVLVLVALCLLSPATRADDFIVNVLTDTTDGACDDGTCSLRDAIDAAESDPLTYDRVLLGPGVHELTSSLEITGVVDILGQEGTEIRAMTDFTPVLSFDGGVLFRGGSGPGPSTLEAILREVKVSGARPEIARSIRGIGFGGGASVSCGALLLDDVWFDDNQAGYSGGALSVGGAQCLTDVEIIGSVFTNNEASCGGAIELWEGFQGETVLRIDETTFQGNRAGTQGGSGSGGALCSEMGSPTLRVQRSTFVGNTATQSGGAAILSTSGVDAVFENSTFSANRAEPDNRRGASGAGGAIALYNGVGATLKHCTLADNRGAAPGSSALYGEYDLSDPSQVSPFTLVNTLLVESTCNAPLLASSGNIESPGSTCGFEVLGAGVDDVPILDIGLEPLAKNGGLTPTHAIVSGSSAEGVGNAAQCDATDQRRVPRDGFGCDVGAYAIPYCSDPQLVITDADPVGVSDDIVLGGIRGGTPAIAKLDVYVKIDHTYLWDLEVTLLHVESGRTATLIDAPLNPGGGFCSADDVDVFFDGMGTVVVDPCASNEPTAQALPGARYLAADLGVFSGLDLDGTWRLKAVDSTVPDEGTLQRWCLAPTLGIFVDGFESGNTSRWSSSSPLP